MELHGGKRSSTELGEAKRQEDPSYSHDILCQKAQKKVEVAHGVVASGLSPQAIRRLEKTTDRLKEKIGNAELSGSGDKRSASEDEATRTMAMSALEEIQARYKSTPMNPITKIQKLAQVRKLRDALSIPQNEPLASSPHVTDTRGNSQERSSVQAVERLSSAGELRINMDGIDSVRALMQKMNVNPDDYKIPDGVKFNGRERRREELQRRSRSLMGFGIQSVRSLYLRSLLRLPLTSWTSKVLEILPLEPNWQKN